jgi:hypothetical protein
LEVGLVEEEGVEPIYSTLLAIKEVSSYISKVPRVRAHPFLR